MVHVGAIARLQSSFLLCTYRQRPSQAQRIHPPVSMSTPGPGIPVPFLRQCQSQTQGTRKPAEPQPQAAASLRPASPCGQAQWGPWSTQIPGRPALPVTGEVTAHTRCQQRSESQATEQGGGNRRHQTLRAEPARPAPCPAPPQSQDTPPRAGHPGGVGCPSSRPRPRPPRALTWMPSSSLLTHQNVSASTLCSASAGTRDTSAASASSSSARGVGDTGSGQPGAPRPGTTHVPFPALTQRQSSPTSPLNDSRS